MDFADGSVDLVTSCQAAHWFDDIGAFYAEADRVLRPGGAIAVYGYHFTDPVGTDNAAVEEFVSARPVGSSPPEARSAVRKFRPSKRKLGICEITQPNGRTSATGGGAKLSCESVLQE